MENEPTLPPHACKVLFSMHVLANKVQFACNWLHIWLRDIACVAASRMQSCYAVAAKTLQSHQCYAMTLEK